MPESAQYTTLHAEANATNCKTSRDKNIYTKHWFYFQVSALELYIIAAYGFILTEISYCKIIEWKPENTTIQVDNENFITIEININGLSFKCFYCCISYLRNSI